MIRIIKKLFHYLRKDAEDKTIIDTFNKAQEYFLKNKSSMRNKHFAEIETFTNIYNKLTKEKGSGELPSNYGVAIALLFRALKYLYSAIDLISAGHMDEGIILTRNTMELRIIALDIAFTKEGIKLWNLTQNEKEYIKQNNDGIIDSKKLKDRILSQHGSQILSKLSFKATMKRVKRSGVLKAIEIANRVHGQYNDISEYRSHENIFNIVRRTDTMKNSRGNYQTVPYLGFSSSSNIILYLYDLTNC